MSTGQRIAGGAAILLFAFLFLPWFVTPTREAVLPSGEPIDLSGIDTSNIDTGGDDISGWAAENPLDVYLLITVLVTLAGVALAGRGRRGPATLMSLSAVTFVLGAIGTILVLYQVFDVPDDFTRKYGLFLALAAVAGVAVGGWLSMQEEAAGSGERY